MDRRGRLSVEKMGHSMPVEATPYPAPPIYFRDAQAINIAFETDPEAALEALPIPLTLPEPATAVLSFLKYPWTTLGPYLEAMVLIFVEYQGRPAAYLHQIACDSEAALLAGREIWGCPKRLASFDYGFRGGVISGRMQRDGVRIASASFRPERPLEAEPAESAAAIGLRVVPAIDPEAKEPLCAELIEAFPEKTVQHAWEGTGAMDFGERSAFNPWSTLPVRRVVQATHEVYDQVLAMPRVIERL